ncbi:hypothetical protein NON20_16290 [Synechocystis sp. B12]|nr:hypothetical protein NON20_16290 [Synechocystis sp. B12]
MGSLHSGRCCPRRSPWVGEAFSPVAVNGFRESGLPFRRPPGLCC